MRNKRGLWLVVGITLVAMSAVLVPYRADAQGSSRPVQVGGKAAWNLSRVRGEAFADDEIPIVFKTGNGFSVGGLLAFAAGSNVTIQPEFLYSQKKVKADVIAEGRVANGEIDTDWFEIPVLAKFHGNSDRGVRPFAMAGATFSFLVNARQSLTLDGMTETEDIKDELNGTDVGITLGGGVDFMQDWGVVTVDARYTFGLRQLGEPDEGESIKQDTFAVSAGVIF